ncbi:MAG: sialate O-acetylesterase [Pseudomonadota bacterium]
MTVAIAVSTSACIADHSLVSVEPLDAEPPSPQTQDTPFPVAEQESPPAVDDPPEVAKEPPTTADITDLILITGQSNALGAGTAYDYRIDTPDNRVFAYTNDGWQMADLHQIWDQGWFPRTNPGTEPANNFALHFGKQVVALAPERVLGFVLITAPGQPIAHWQADGEFFNSTRDKVSNAINTLPAKAQVDGILWHQGESDGRDDDAYGRALYQLIDDFRSEPWFGVNKSFICSETAALPVNRQLNKLNHDSDPWTACIAAEGLPTRDFNAHFNAESLRTIGRRYADRYVQMTR